MVYLARDPLLDREVAVKVIPTGWSSLATARASRRKRSCNCASSAPGVVGIHDFGSDDGSLFYVMPLMRGQNLRELAIRGELAAEPLLSKLAVVG